MTESTNRFTDRLSRRSFLKAASVAGIAIASGGLIGRLQNTRESKTDVFIASVQSYQVDLRKVIQEGLQELGVSEAKIKGKRILLKPNLVEPHRGFTHINTHPLIVRAAAESFLALGATSVFVAEGAGHQRDAYLVLEESGLADVLFQDRIRFLDLNSSPVVKMDNAGKVSRFEHLYFPKEVMDADWVVSLAKMKTHHWAGVTLSMKNLFGVMPGSIYGWPKNALHAVGIGKCIYDINATLKPHFAIVDGIVGMEGDGPIMGEPIDSQVLVMGTNLPAVDATCSRIMGIDPEKIPYLSYSSGRIGAIKSKNIRQRGESIETTRKDFKLLDFIPAHKDIRGT
jgi:uncharacterized protein (DUF362 family)